jgi:hypothetical protein
VVGEYATDMGGGIRGEILYKETTVRKLCRMQGHPVPISKVVDGAGLISSFCQSCWDGSDFHKHLSATLPMDLMKMGHFQHEHDQPGKGRVQG